MGRCIHTGHTPIQLIKPYDKDFKSVAIFYSRNVWLTYITEDALYFKFLNAKAITKSFCIMYKILTEAHTL